MTNGDTAPVVNCPKFSYWAHGQEMRRPLARCSGGCHLGTFFDRVTSVIQVAAQYEYRRGFGLIRCSRNLHPLVAGEVPLFWTSDELAQNLLYCGGTKGFAQAPRVAWVKTGF